MKDETLSIHFGYETDPTTKSVATPIYQTVAYEFDNAQHGADLFNLEVPGNIYTRIMNPTQAVVEERIAAAYVMGQARFGQLSVLTGVRVEDTRVAGEGPLNYISPAEKARRAAWTGPVTDAETIRRAEAQYGERMTVSGPASRAGSCSATKSVAPSSTRLRAAGSSAAARSGAIRVRHWPPSPGFTTHSAGCSSTTAQPPL